MFCEAISGVRGWASARYWPRGWYVVGVGVCRRKGNVGVGSSVSGYLGVAGSWTRVLLAWSGCVST